jgi:hypothetical protein
MGPRVPICISVELDGMCLKWLQRLSSSYSDESNVHHQWTLRQHHCAVPHLLAWSVASPANRHFLVTKFLSIHSMHGFLSTFPEEKQHDQSQYFKQLGKLTSEGVKI